MRMPIDCAARDDLFRQLIRIAIRRSIGLRVQVVKFADCCGAGHHHLEKGHAGDIVNVSRVQRSSRVIHAATPGPEVAPAGCTRLCLASDEALKAVRVRIDEAGQDGFSGKINDVVSDAGRRAVRSCGAFYIYLCYISCIVDEQACIAQKFTAMKE